MIIQNTNFFGFFNYPHSPIWSWVEVPLSFILISYKWKAFFGVRDLNTFYFKCLIILSQLDSWLWRLLNKWDQTKDCQFKDATHSVEGWAFFFCPPSTALIPFEAAVVEAGFFVSVVFTAFFAVDLLLSPDGCGFAVVVFLVSLDFSTLSFPFWKGVCLEPAAFGLTDFLLVLLCLWCSRKLQTKLFLNIKL